MQIKKSYPISFKHHYIEELHVLGQMSLVHVAAAMLSLPKSTAHDWLQGKHLDNEGRKPTCLKNHGGALSFLKHIAPQLIAYFEDTHAKGYSVSKKLLAAKACNIDPGLWNKNRRACHACVAWFMISQSLVLCTMTTRTQKSPIVLHNGSVNFTTKWSEKIKDPKYHQDYIINIDKLPICYAIVNKRTYSVKGVKEVVRRTSSNAKKHVTCVWRVTGSSKKLKPIIIYKAAPNGPVIEEIQDFSNKQIHHCQQDAWM
jgi:hypothetical protein